MTNLTSIGFEAVATKPVLVFFVIEDEGDFWEVGHQNFLG